MASSELLKQIQAGKRLKKAETNDRSAPLVDSKPSVGGGAAVRAGGGPALVAPAGGPPQLGGLFAGGVPKLKPTGQSHLAKPPTLGKPPSVPKRDHPPPPPPSVRNPPPLRPSLSTPLVAISPAMADRPPPLPSRTPPALPPRVPPAVPSRSTPIARNAASPPPLSALPARPHPPLPPVSSPSRPVSPPRVASRAVPPLPPQRNSAQQSRNAPHLPTGRPLSMAGSRLAPLPPHRNSPATDAPAAHVRALSEVDSSTSSWLGPPVYPAPPVGRPSINGSVNGSRKMPSPPPNVGSHMFPLTDFPPPRSFVAEVRRYGSGRTSGSDFDLSSL